MDPIEHLKAVNKLLLSALEHCPQHTRDIIGQVAGQHLSAIEAALPKPEPAKA